MRKKISFQTVILLLCIGLSGNLRAEDRNLLSELLNADENKSYETALPKDIFEETRSSFLEDLNDDGVPEILVPLTKGSVNSCVAAFTYSPATGGVRQIDFFAGDLCSPIKRGNFLISKYRSGARWNEDIYAIENGEFKIAFSDSCLGCDWVSRKEYRNNSVIKHHLVNNAQYFEQRSPLLASISVASAMIYTEADKNSVSDFSLTQGDIVLIKNTIQHDDVYFVEIESAHTPTISGWIKCESLNQCDSL